MFKGYILFAKSLLIYFSKYVLKMKTCWRIINANAIKLNIAIRMKKTHGFSIFIFSETFICFRILSSSHRYRYTFTCILVLICSLCTRSANSLSLLFKELTFKTHYTSTKKLSPTFKKHWWTLNDTAENMAWLPDLIFLKDYHVVYRCLTLHLINDIIVLQTV